MKKTSVLLALLAAAALFSACWSQEEIDQDPKILDDQQYRPETVYIGSLVPLTGPDAERAALLQAAQETAAEIINEAHDLEWDVAANAGISGYGASRVELVYADCGTEESAADAPATQPASQAEQGSNAAQGGTQTTAQSQTGTGGEEPDPAALAARQLIDEGVVALIGAYRSQPTAAAAQVAAGAGLPLLSGTASLDNITDGESYDLGPWFDRIAPTVDMHSQLFFSYVKHLNQTEAAAISSVALAYRDDYFGREVLRSFDQQAEAYGLQVVARIAYKDSGSDLATAAYRMMANRPQAVFHYGEAEDVTAFAGYYGAARFSPQVAFCYDIAFQAPAFWETVTAAKAEYWCGLSSLLFPAGEEEEEASANFASDIVSGDSRVFDYVNSLYREKTGLDMDNEAIYDFAAVIVLAQAVGSAGSTDAERLAAALRERDFDAPYLASGHISFNELGQNQVNAGYLTLLTADGFELAFKP